nr:uncharacterized protein LOC105849330 [Hydra vulgaris]
MYYVIVYLICTMYLYLTCNIYMYHIIFCVIVLFNLSYPCHLLQLVRFLYYDISKLFIWQSNCKSKFFVHYIFFFFFEVSSIAALSVPPLSVSAVPSSSTPTVASSSAPTVLSSSTPTVPSSSTPTVTSSSVPTGRVYYVV